jgi:hypothetical protein
MNFMGGSGRLRGPGGSRGDITPKGYRTGQLAQFTPEQNELFKQQFSHLGPDSYLSRLAGGDESLFDEMEAPALRQFQGTLGGIASKFSGQGMGSRRSSGFQNETTAAASNFAQQLQSQRQGLQRQAINDLMGMSNTLLNQRPYERFMTQKEQKQPSGWGSIGGGILGGIGGAFFGQPVQGAMFGSALGSQF